MVQPDVSHSPKISCTRRRFGSKPSIILSFFFFQTFHTWNAHIYTRSSLTRWLCKQISKQAINLDQNNQTRYTIAAILGAVKQRTLSAFYYHNYCTKHFTTFLVGGPVPSFVHACERPWVQPPIEGFWSDGFVAVSSTSGNRPATLTSMGFGFLLVFYSNHNLKSAVVEIKAWNRQTERRWTDGRIAAVFNAHYQLAIANDIVRPTCDTKHRNSVFGSGVIKRRRHLAIRREKKQVER